MADVAATFTDRPVVLQWPGSDHTSSVAAAVDTLRRAEPIKYTLSSLGPYSMLLVPSADAAATRPLCHVSWREDFWSPGDLVTLVREGGSQEGQLVGEFG